MYTVFDPHLMRMPGDVIDYLDIIAAHGIEGVGGLTSKLFDDEKKALETAKRVWDLGLKWGVMFTPVDFYAANIDDGIFDEGIETLKRQCALAQKMGVQFAYNHVWSSNDDRDFAKNFDWHIRRIKRVQKVFVDNGIFYGLEFLGPRDVLHRYKYEFIHTITGAVALAIAAGNQVGFLFDTYHWYCEGSRMDDLYFALHNTDKMCGFHINDGVAGRSRDEQKDLERAMPMSTGVIDSATVYKLFAKYGYKGPVAIEPLQPTINRFQGMTPEQCIAEFSETYRRIEK